MSGNESSPASYLLCWPVLPHAAAKFHVLRDNFPPPTDDLRKYPPPAARSPSPDTLAPPLCPGSVCPLPQALPVGHPRIAIAPCASSSRSSCELLVTAA